MADDDLQLLLTATVPADRAHGYSPVYQFEMRSTASRAEPDRPRVQWDARLIDRHFTLMSGFGGSAIPFPM